VSTESTNRRQATNESVPEDEAADTEAHDVVPDDSAETEQNGEVEALKNELEDLQEERDELNDRLLRKTAEFENFRRRMDREKKRRHQAGKERVVELMLEVLDDFERSLDAAEDLEDSEDVESAYESLKGGVEMVFRKFQDQLQSLGVEPIEAEGKPFDEQYHEAMMRQPSGDVEPGTVLQEIRKGYTMGDRVIRHSRVVVAAEPADDGESN
jgi:molecular chaperone GrpE